MALLYYKIMIKEALELFVGACIPTEQRTKTQNSFSDLCVIQKDKNHVTTIMKERKKEKTFVSNHAYVWLHTHLEEVEEEELDGLRKRR